MSAFAVYLSDNKIMVATDTLLFRDFYHNDVSDQKPISVPIGFSQKVLLCANYRCIMVCFGFHKTANHLQDFINDLNGCGDVDSLVKEIEDNFYNSIDFKDYAWHENEKTIPGCIQVFGFSEIEQRMVWYLVNVHRTHLKSVKKTYAPHSVFCVPFIKDKSEERQIGSRVDLSIYGALVELMKLQYTESLNPSSRTVALGGEIMITTILSKPSFSITFEFAHKFDNFDITKASFEYLKQNNINNK